MKRILAFLVGAALAALCIAAFAAPDWQNLTAQNARDEWTFWQSDGTKADSTLGYRAYIDGCSDTSIVSNSFDWDYSAACLCFVSRDTMNSGARRRSGRFDIFRITGGTDSLVVADAYIEGEIAAVGSVDDSALVANSVGTSEITDKSIQQADVDTAAIGAIEIASDAVGADEIATAAVDSAEVENSGLSLADLKTASAAAAGEALIATGSAGMDWGSTVVDWTATGDLSSGDDVLANGDVVAAGGTVTAGDSDTGGILVLNDGSSNTFTQTAPATSVNWAIPTCIYADTFLCKTTRTSFGDRIGSIYIQGLLTTDIVVISASASPNGDGAVPIGARYGAEVYPADSLGVHWGGPAASPSAMDDHTLQYLIFRK